MPPKKLDLTGQRFGRLTVISELPKEGSSPRWHCVCDCGKTRNTTTILLRRGDCNSCGCLHDEYLAERHSKTDTDITGKRFGKLVALNKVKVEGKKSRMWLCQCDCGEQKTAAASELKKGHVRSCGCLISEHVNSFFEAGTNVPALLANTLSSRNKSGTKGVHFNSRNNKWMAYIMFQRKNYNLGSFENKRDAIQARKEAEARLHGEFLEWYYSRKENKLIPEQPRRKRKHSDEDLIQSLRDVAKQFPDKYLTVWDYASVCRSPTYQTITTRFGSWGEACKKAGVQTVPRSDDADKHRKDYIRDYQRRKKQQWIAEGKCKNCGGDWIPPESKPGKRKASYCLNCQKRTADRLKRRQEKRLELAQSIMLIYAMLQFYK